MNTYGINQYIKEESYTLVDRIEIDGELYWFNIETGEIMEKVKMYKDYNKDITPVNPINHVEVVSLVQLKNACTFSNEDRNTKAKPTFNTKHTDLFELGLNAKAYATFVALAKKIQYRNVFVTTKNELLKLLKTDDKSLSREIKKLSGLVEVKAPLGQKDATRVLVFNAELVWKGDERMQEVYLDKVYKARTEHCVANHKPF